MLPTPAPARAQRLRTSDDAKRATARNGRRTEYPDAQGSGLVLHVEPSGAKMWRCRVQRAGTRTWLTLGSFPTMTLAEARAARMHARLAADPAAERGRAKAADLELAAATLAAVAPRWLETRARTRNWTPQYAGDMRRRFAKHVLPALGARPPPASPCAKP